jgi:hypothetical protein
MCGTHTRTYNNEGDLKPDPHATIYHTSCLIRQIVSSKTERGERGGGELGNHQSLILKYIVTCMP